MANVADLDAVAAVKLLLKRKDHDHLADVFLDLLHASGAPGPDLWADKVENRNAQTVQFTRQTEVEVRKVDQDGCVGLAPRRFGNQMLEAPADSRQMRQNFHQTNPGDFIGMDQQLGASRTHLFSAHAKEG